MTEVELRIAGPADSDLAFEIKKAAFRQYVEPYRGWDEDLQRSLHEQRFPTQDQRIVRVDGIDVAVIASEWEPDALKLNQLFILPEYQSQGIGRQCMEILMREATQRGVPIRLQVLKVNPRARSFYERLGFAVVGESETHDQMEWRRSDRSVS